MISVSKVKKISGSDSNQTQQSESHHNGTDPESNDSKQLSSEVINTMTGKPTPVENNAGRPHVEEAKLSDTENAANKASNIISASRAVPCGQPLHTVNTNTTEEDINEAPSTRKNVSVSSATDPEMDESNYIVPCKSGEVTTLSSASDTRNQELVEQSEANIKDHELRSDDRDSIAGRDSIESEVLANRQMSNNKLDSPALHIAVDANEFGDGITNVDHNRSSDSIPNSTVTSVYSSNAEMDDEFNSSNEFIDDAPNSSNPSTIPDEETKKIPGNENRQQISDSEAGSAPNTARRILKSSDSTNIGDRTISSIKTDENSNPEIEGNVRHDVGNKGNINNENNSGEKFSSESCNENITRDPESFIQATTDEDSECDKHQNITSNEGPARKMDSNLIHPGSDACSLIGTEQHRQRSIEREVDLNFPIDNNVSKVIDIGNTENSNRKTSITSRNIEQNLDEEKMKEKFVDTTASDDENYERSELMKGILFYFH